MSINMLGRTCARFFSKSSILCESQKKKFPSSLDHAGHEGEEGFKIWRNIGFAMIAGVAGLTVSVYLEHKSKKEERTKFIPYEHMRIRTKRFAWGEGQRSFFHNEHVNPLPDGYEDGQD